MKDDTALDKIYVGHLKITGLYGVLQNEQKGFHLNALVFAFCLLNSLTITPIVYYNLIITVKDLSFFVWFTLLSLPFLTSITNALIFIANRSRVNKLRQICNWDYLNSSNPEYRRYILNSFIKKCNSKSIKLTYAMSLNVVLWLATGFFAKRTKPYLTSLDPNKKLGKYTLLDVYYPMENTDSGLYLYLTLLQEIAGLVLIIFLTMAVPLHFQVFVTMFCAQIQVLQNELESIIHGSTNGSNESLHDRVPSDSKLIYHKKLQNTSTYSDQINDLKRKIHEEQLHSELIKVIKDHRKIIILFQDLCTVYNPVISVIMSATTVGACLLGFKLLMSEKIFSLENLRDVHYMISITALVFICSLQGSIIKHKFESINNSLYACDWINGNKNFKTALKIFMTQVQKPMALTAFKCVLVDLMAFVKVMKMSYSYYAALYNVSKR